MVEAQIIIDEVFSKSDESGFAVPENIPDPGGFVLIGMVRLY